MFHTDAERIRFLLEAEADLGLWLGDERLDAVAKATDEDRPRYVTNYIGSKQKLIDWIWDATPDGAKTAVDAFSGSSVVGYMYKSHGLGVHAVDRLAYCHHIARAIVENDGVTLKVGDRTRVGTVQRLEVVAARGEPVATAHLELSNVRFEWQDGAADGDPLVVRWGYRGQALAPLFDGTVQRALLRETLSVWGLCRARALMDTRVTRTYQDEAADAIVRHLVEGAGFASLDLAACATEIDKLPLQDNTLVEALGFLDRRLVLGRDAWADPQGVLHWGPRDESQEPAATFTLGDDVLDWRSLPGGGLFLAVMGAPLWHSSVVEILDRAGQATRYFVEKVRHTAGNGGAGVRSDLWLSEVGHG